MKYLQIAVVPSILVVVLSWLAIPVIAVRPQYSSGSLGNSHTKTGSSSAVTAAFLTDGTIQLRVNNVMVSSGIPTILGATPTTTTGVAISPTHGQLAQLYVTTGLVITYDCVLNGTDLTITASVQNNGMDTTPPISFLLPSFGFVATPTGTIPYWNWSYINSQGINSTYHPCASNPVGCVYAADANYAVSVWSPSEIATQSMINASWASDNYIANPMPIEFHTVETVPPGANVIMSVVLRLSTDQSIAGLLSGYKAIVPPMSYTPVNQPVIAEQGIGANFVSVDNPYGYDGAWRRIDWPQGVQQFLGTMMPMLQAANGAGVIFWAPGGYQSTNFYPVDIDTNLSRIITTWPNLTSGFKANGYRVGSIIRCGQTLNPDGTVRLADPNNSADVNAMLTRLDYVANTGVDMWYVDSSCYDYGSMQLTAIAKKHLPASHIFYSEFCSDISMSFSGVYCEWIGAKTMWLTEPQRAQLMYLYPNSSWICKDDTNTLTNAQIMALGFQPLLQD